MCLIHFWRTITEFTNAQNIVFLASLADVSMIQGVMVQDLNEAFEQMLGMSR